MSFSEFVDAYPPGHIKGFPFSSSPRWDTDITTVKNGASMRNSNWSSPLHRFTAPQAIRSQPDFEAVKDMWLVLNGPAKTFPFRDPMDFASVPLAFTNEAPSLSAADQDLGAADGFTRLFSLVKTYTFGTDSFTRPIALPVVSSVLVAMNGLDPATADPTLPGGPYTWTVSRPGGVITFDHEPTAGIEITAGFLFDVHCRFEADDTFDGIVQTFRNAGFADLSFVEERAC